MFDMDSIKQGIVAALAAVILTTTAVGAAVAPAEAVASPAFAALQAGEALRG
jgi:hypothetical protein